MAVGIQGQPTPFERAFQDLLDSTKSQPRKHLSKFLLKCQKASKQVSLKSASDLIAQAENSSSERVSRRVTRKVLEPVVESLKAYDKVISTLCSADPMPTAIIWGSLKVIIDCTDRYANLFTIIRTQLSALRDRIEDVHEYEGLFGRSPELQRALFEFYKNVLRFWSRVDKECHRPNMLSVVQSVVPLTMTKIRNIINDIEDDVDKIHTKVQYIDLKESKNERELNLQARQASEDAEMGLLIGRLRDWLDPSAFQYSSDAHTRHVAQITPGTLEWLRDDKQIRAWSSTGSQIPHLWASAAPGFGKTIACTKVIENIKQDNPDAAVCYHFYQGNEFHSGREILRSFASQLLENVWSNVPKIIPDVRKIVQTHKDITDNIVALIELMLKELEAVFFFVDGLDEVAANNDNNIVIDTLSSLCVKFTSKVRFWCSSQSTAHIKEMMGSAKAITLDGRNDLDVHRYLHRALQHKYQSEDIDEEDQIADIATVASQLCNKAHGSFMWAYLMRHDIEQADTPAELSAIMNSDVPDGLDQYYKRILHRIEKPKWALASLLLSLVCFSRRPLRIAELREAVAMLGTKDKSCVDRKRRPFPRDMQKILLPLIQLEDRDHYGKVYSACHSTLKDFLHRNPNILCSDPNNSCNDTISGLILGDVCLQYLQQDRFSRFLVKRDDIWYIQDGSEEGSTMEKNPFTAYAAKYWSTHLGAAYHPKGSPIYKRTMDFVTSPQFWTCIQIQSIFVAGQFCTYTLQGWNRAYKFKKPTFPRWFGHEPDSHIFSQFRTFLNEWEYFLDNCNSGVTGYGEVDRCLASVIGSTRFLANVKSRYNDFCLDLEGDNDSGYDQFHNISAGGERLSLLNVSCDPVNEHFEINVSHVQFSSISRSPTPPDLKFKVATDTINWLSYTCMKHIGDRSCVCVGKPSLASISSCGQIFRVGNKLWKRGENSKLVTLKFDRQPRAEDLIEHVECKDNHIFVTSRQKVHIKRSISCLVTAAARNISSVVHKSHHHLAAEFYGTFANSDQQVNNSMMDEHCLMQRRSAMRSLRDKSMRVNNEPAATVQTDDSDSELGSSGGDDSSIDHEFETEQYMSEASSVPEKYDLLMDVASMHNTAEGVDETDTHGATSSSSGDEEARSERDESDEDTTDSEMSITANLGVSATDNGTQKQHQYFEDMLEDYVRDKGDSDSSDNFGGVSSGDEDGGGAVERHMNFMEGYVQERSARIQSDDDDEDSRRKRKLLIKSPVAALRVYRNDGNTLKPVFKFVWSNARPVCNSPPAYHPFKPLVAWPVTDSLLLFADYSENTWFKQKLRPPRNCRFVTIRCQFSACGKYLHIAALKRRLKEPAPKTTKKKKKNKKAKTEESSQKGASAQNTFALMVLTFVLSAKKTSYSRPRLIYRHALSLPAMKVPIMTFIWTKDELFATHSSVVLCTSRVKLFPDLEDAELSKSDANHLVATAHKVCQPVDGVAKAARMQQTENRVRVPNEPIYLPYSARNRPVYFVPNANTASDGQENGCVGPRSNGKATVMVGPDRPPLAVHRTTNLMRLLRSYRTTGKEADEADVFVDKDDGLTEEERREQQVIGAGGYSHMIGMTVDDEKDLGGWRVSDSTESIGEGQGIGNLDDMMELFDPQDDCEDIEPWIMPSF